MYTPQKDMTTVRIMQATKVIPYTYLVGIVLVALIYNNVRNTGKVLHGYYSYLGYAVNATR